MSVYSEDDFGDIFNNKYIDTSIPVNIDFQEAAAGGKHFQRQKDTISADEVRQKIQEHSVKIFELHGLLRDLWCRHGNTFQNRWKNRNQKRKIQDILHCWPGMAAPHRPDFVIFHKEDKSKRKDSTTFRDAFLVPFMNQTDLAKPSNLPLLLSSRANFSPADFALHDLDASHFGRVSGEIATEVLKSHTIMFTGQNEAKTYGKLLDWRKEPKAVVWCLTGRGMRTGEGLLVLEAQHKILDFLVKICQLVLRDVETSTDSASLPLPEPSSVPKLSAQDHPSPVTMAAGASYRDPTKVDFSRIVESLDMKLLAAQDHVWSLREDPGYFTIFLSDVNEHALGTLPDVNLKKDRLLEGRLTEGVWLLTTAGMITDSFLRLETWRELRKQATELHQIYGKFRAQISPPKILLTSFLNALLKFQLTLHEAAKLSRQIITYAACSPPLRQYFVRVSSDGTDSAAAQKAVLKPNVKLDKVEKLMISLLDILGGNKKDLACFGMRNVVSQLDWLIQSEPKAMRMLSSSITSNLADICTIYECLGQIETFYPWAGQSGESPMPYMKEFQKHFHRRAPGWLQIMGIVHHSVTLGAMRFVRPDDKKLYYPAEKPRSKETVDAMRQAESNLDEFWKIVDSGIRRGAALLSPCILELLLFSPPCLQRTPPWEDSSKRNITGSNSIDGVGPSTRLLSEIDFELQKRTEATLANSENFTVAQSKAKIKTKGAPGASVHNPPVEVNSQSSLSAAQAKMAVDKRALKVFWKLFYVPSESFTPGALEWNDFEHAMGCMGFRMDPGGGSERTFRSTDCSEKKKSIVVHKPHSPGKFSYVGLRHIGRRLFKRFNWHGEMFVLAEKTESSGKETPTA